MAKLKDKDFAKMEKTYSDYNKYVEKNPHFYFSYTARIIVILISVFVIGVIAYNCFNQAFSKEKNETLNYSTKVELNSNLKLFDNNPLGVNNEGNENSNLSELVDSISNDIYYEYELDQNVDVDYSYYVEAYMVLEDTSTKKEFYTNTYTLIDKKDKIKGKSRNSSLIKFKQNINLDYEFYNDKAKEMAELSSGSVDGKLVIKLFVTLSTKYEKFADSVSKDDVVEITVPLLTNQVSAELTSSKENSDKYIEKAKPELVNEAMLYSGVALLIIDTMFLLTGISFIFRSTPKKSKYTKLKDGLLSEYDEIIVNIRKMPDIKGKNIISCYDFKELVDAQKILEKPILYYEIVKDQKCMFFIIGDDDIYEFTLKKCDIEF